MQCDNNGRRSDDSADRCVHEIRLLELDDCAPSRKGQVRGARTDRDGVYDAGRAYRAWLPATCRTPRRSER
jgi:hypothetical protein